MMPVRFALVLLALLAGAAVHAQPFVVTQTAPADFATGVPLTTTLSFTLSAPLAPLTAQPAPPLIAFPDSAIAVGTPTLSADRRTLRYPVTLQPATRYVVLLPTATSETGQRLARPAAINLTTSASGGFLTIRGTVSDPTGGAVDGTLAAIVTADLSTGAFSIVAMRVLDAAGSSQAYTLGPLPLGIYFAAALRLPGAILGGAASEPALGVYDTNGDGIPDPILSPTGIDIVLQAPPAITARENIDAVTAAAEGALDGAYLDAIPPRTVNASGASTYWAYRFASASDPSDLIVYQIGPLSLPVPAAAIAPVADALPRPFIDSDAALAAADAAGGTAFRAMHPGQTLVVTMETAEPTVAVVPVWRIRYEAQGAPAGTFEADVDLVTGMVVRTTAGEPAPTDDRAGLTVASANPARGTVRLVATLPAATAARVDVLDALGRTVAVLHDGPLGAGATPLAWAAAAVPAGVYRVRLRTATGTTTQAVTVLR